MPQFQIRSYSTILQRMIARVVARSSLSDLSETSALRHILAAVAREEDEGYFQMSLLLDSFSIDRATGFELDDRARDIQPNTLRRLGPRQAQGFIVFSRGFNDGSTITIGAGTAVRTTNGITVRTLEEAVITNTSPAQITGHGVGVDSAPVAASADNASAASNVAANTLTSFISRPAQVVAVTNPAAFIGGRDQETDDEFRARLKLYIASLARSTVDALKFAVLGVVDPTANSAKQVRYASVFEDPVQRGNVTIYVDDGLGTAQDTVSVVGEVVTTGLNGPPTGTAVGGEEYLRLDNWPIDVSQPISINLVTPAPASIPITQTLGVDVFLNPADGLLRFATPLLPAYSVTADYTHYVGLIQEVQKVIDGDPLDRSTYPGYRPAGTRVLVKEPLVRSVSVEMILTVDEDVVFATAASAALSEVLSYINQLSISEDVIRSEIIARVRRVPGVSDITLVTPSTNVAIYDNEVARTTSAAISVS